MPSIETIKKYNEEDMVDAIKKTNALIKEIERCEGSINQAISLINQAMKWLETSKRVLEPEKKSKIINRAWAQVHQAWAQVHIPSDAYFRHINARLVNTLNRSEQILPQDANALFDHAFMFLDALERENKALKEVPFNYIHARARIKTPDITALNDMALSSKTMLNYAKKLLDIENTLKIKVTAF